MRAVGNGSNAAVDNRGAQGTDAPYQAEGAVASVGPTETPSDESPGVPGFRTWRGIYLFVFVSFGLVVVLLALFSRLFA